MEQLLARRHIDCKELLELLSAARSSSSVPGLLGLEDHPALLKLGKARPASMRVALAKVIYHGDLENMFYSTDEAKKFDNKRKRQEIAVDARLLKQAGKVIPI